jgi:hypothetical protein
LTLPWAAGPSHREWEADTGGRSCVMFGWYDIELGYTGRLAAELRAILDEYPS